MHGGHEFWGMQGFLGMHWVWWIVWGAVILWAIRMIRRSTGDEPDFPESISGRSGESPLTILQQRYAAGEISTAEFEERKAHLTQESDSLAQSKRQTQPL